MQNDSQLLAFDSLGLPACLLTIDHLEVDGQNETKALFF